VHSTGAAEGTIAAGLEQIQGRYPELDLGSYPYYRASGQGVAIVAKGNDAARAEAAIAEVTVLFESLGATPIPGEPAV
jgi:molybdopterin-biosynthesis enzyme MoeA-like protein